MGIGVWVRRLFGWGKSGNAVPCNLCRCEIPASDLAKGTAVVIARQKYCRGCVDEITRRAQTRPGWTLTNDVGSSSTIFLR